MRKKLTTEEVRTLQRVADRIQEQTGRKLGRCLFKALENVDKGLAYEIIGKDGVDPFYCDKNIPGFLRYIIGDQGNVDQN